MEEKKRLNGAGFYAVLGVLLVALGLGGWAYTQTRPEPADPLPPVTDPVHQPAIVPQPKPETPAVPPAPKPAPTPMPESRPTAAGADIPAAPEEPPVPEEPEEAPTLIVYPVNGQVLAAFSADELQYSETLDDWRIHDGIDLSAQPGATVLAACAGTVEAVEADDLMGMTVTVSHAGGYETLYANLQAKPPVLPGDEVSAGQIIGAVGATALAEQAQPPHLHFAVRKDGCAVDPEVFLNP